MSKFGKFLFGCTVVGVTAAAVYYYLEENAKRASDDFDDDLSKQLATKLAGYPFRMTQADKLKEAIAYIDDFMYDEAAQLIREIGQTIE